MDYSFFDENKIIPVVVINDINDTLPKLNALSKGGIKVAEITFRTDCAEEAIRLASKSMDGMLIGAGTVINESQCIRAIEAGAKFIVSPGLSEEVAKVCKDNDIAYLPGVVTPTEIIKAISLGFTTLKFFPAGAYGGIKTLKALSAAFVNVKFVPTGGVDESNMLEFLSQKFVRAIGGSWMMKGTLEDIERTSKEAINKLEELK